MKKIVFIFSAVFGIVLCLLFFLPIPLFDGVIYYEKELVSFSREAKLSLSYFLNIGTENLVLNGIAPTRFELAGIGYLLVVLIPVGIPALVAYRVHLSNEVKRHQKNSQS